MALLNFWDTFFVDAGIPSVEARIYAEKFVENRITDPTDLTDQHLKDLGVTVIGDKIAIQKHAKLVGDQDTKPHAIELSATPSLRYKPGNIVHPLLKADCT